MALPNVEVIVIEQTKVSPPPGSVPTTSLPLTFFDLPWLLNFSHMQRPYFYDFPHPTNHFLETLLPSLKNSLSLTLQHFFPLAGNLRLPPPPAKPHILFTDGDSVSLTVAESTADFHFLSANHPLPVRAFDPFVPKFAPALVVDGTRVEPLLALQATVFPNSGICIGIRRNHVVSDGKAFHHFMKSWASICNTGGDLITRLDRELRPPSHDRTAIKDQYGLELELLNAWWSTTLASARNDDGDEERPVLDCGTIDNVRAPFILHRVQIERLKSWVTNQLANDESSSSFHMSSFIVTCALIWVCLAKSEERNSALNTDKDDEPYYFAFVAECRSRLEFPLPTTYFGNCMKICFAPVKRKELLRENGIVAAAKAIGKEVGELNEESLKKFENWMMKFKKIKELGWQHVTVTGSPKLGVYEADFGWGRPKKSETVHFSDATTISLAESRDEKSGVEVGLALNKDRLSRFGAILEETLTHLA
ncbi:Malonyl-coenzyme A:anthocyanin 3-O-glucoside-6''-O-malonyltransferase [Morus notabilis]|uniref:Malonyl-coenzyme A:anthocyanin 3-O-glucoside-6''-O-malonyltransferase n=1 Tax=Morus notabilis TaxID=981085 RepID=W9S8V1_9ROSA|nr:coumaroyl-CoA:anthocyanidin 3-O-glucoside-6''-O-coumaroyltransferase 1 [Morus notabilis]EXB94481.1 Malonyl-coenzyme A:anthocyanin 3-O-glucoside-6''-O-malonyltransferase [Morus notabilis]